MKKTFLILLLGFMLSGTSYAQPEKKTVHHRLGIELLGESFYFSMQYDYKPLKKIKFLPSRIIGIPF